MKSFRLILVLVSLCILIFTDIGASTVCTYRRVSCVQYSCSYDNGDDGPFICSSVMTGVKGKCIPVLTDQLVVNSTDGLYAEAPNRVICNSAGSGPAIYTNYCGNFYTQTDDDEEGSNCPWLSRGCGGAAAGNCPPL